MDNRPDGVMTLKEYAAELGVTRARVHQLVKATGLTLKKFAGVCILTAEDRAAIQQRPRRASGRPRKTPVMSAAVSEMAAESMPEAV